MDPDLLEQHQRRIDPFSMGLSPPSQGELVGTPELGSVLTLVWSTIEENVRDNRDFTLAWRRPVGPVRASWAISFSCVSVMSLFKSNWAYLGLIVVFFIF